MNDFNLAEAKERLEELLERAARGETIRITGTKHGSVELAVNGMKLYPKRVPGLMKGKAFISDEDLFAPLTEEELRLTGGYD